MKRAARRWITGMFLLVCFRPTGACGQELPVLPEVAYKRLLNDLQIAVATVPSAGEDMTIGLALRYGSAFDPAQKGGLGHLVSRLLMKSTMERTAKEIQDELAYLNARLEVRCDWDGFRFLMRVPAARFERALLLLYQAVGEAQFREEDFERTRSEVLKELSQPEDPRQRNRRQFEIALFRGTTYGRHPRGSSASVQNISLGDVRLHYRRFFSPNASALAVVGGVPAPLVIQKASRIWGVWVRKDEVPPTFLPARPPAARQIFLEDDPGSTAVQFVLGNLWPRREDPRYYPAALAARILQERLTKALPTSLITVGSEGRRLDGAFFVQGQAAADQAISEIQKVLEISEALKIKEAAAEEAAEAQKRWIAEFSDGLKTADGICQVLLDAELYRLGTAYMAAFPEMIRRCTPEVMKETVNEWIFPGGVVIFVRGPAAALKSSLDSMGTVGTATP